MSASPALKPERLWTKLLLWPLAFLMAASAMLYQRATGPTYPSRGTFEVEGEEYKFALLRSQETSEKARIILPAPNPESISATIWWRRYPTDDAFGKEPMLWHPEQEWRSSTLFDLINPPEGVVRKGVGAYTTDLPIQPAAGKVEYYITVDVLDDEVGRKATGDVVVRVGEGAVEAVDDERAAGGADPRRACSPWGPGAYVLHSRGPQPP